MACVFFQQIVMGTRCARAAAVVVRSRWQQACGGVLLSGLRHCHSAGVYHRDLKPENVLLDGNFRFRIADFGFAVKSAASTLLRTTLGTEMFMAPEVRARKEYRGGPADVVRALPACTPRRVPWCSSCRLCVCCVRSGAWA
jgi:serine/threonine protein kinase